MKREYEPIEKDRPYEFWDIAKYFIIILSFMLLIVIYIESERYLQLEREQKVIDKTTITNFTKRGYIIDYKPFVYDEHCTDGL